MIFNRFIGVRDTDIPVFLIAGSVGSPEALIFSYIYKFRRKKITGTL